MSEPPTPDYLAAARACFSLDGLELVRRRAADNGHLTPELEAQLAPFRQALAGMATAPFVTPSVCQGGEEQHDLHVRYCVPLAEQLAGTRTLTCDQAYRLLSEAVSQYRENVDVHAQGEEQAANEAVWGVLDGLFTDLDVDPLDRIDHGITT